MAELLAGAPALAPFSLPELTEARLDNGLSVVVAQRRRLPLVALSLVFKAGSARDPKGKAGLADFTVELLRRGAARLGAAQIDEALELMGAELRLETSPDSTYLSASAPSEHLAPLCALVAELVQRPSFVPAEVVKARRRTVARLATDLDDAATVASDALYRAALGGHPYAHPGRGIASQVASFTRADCLRWAALFLRPQGAHLVVAGDVDPREALALARRRFGSWKSAGAPPVEVPKVAPVEGRSILVVDKPEASQAQVRLACLGPGRTHPEIIAARVANTVLGGGFTSRLVEAIRVSRGLSYGVSSFLSDTEAGGLFCLASFTKTESVRELVEVALEETRRFREEGPTKEELARAQGYTNGLFPLLLETVDQLARALADMKRFGRDPDWFERYRERVAAVTPEQAASVARAFFLPAGFALAAVGEAKALRRALAPFGKVRGIGVERLS
jgi:zinc protease